MAERFKELKKEIQGFTRDERERRNFDPVDVLTKEAEPVPAQNMVDQLLKRISDLESKLSVLSDNVLLKQDLPEMTVDGTTINPLYCMLRTSDTSLALTTKPVNSKGHSFGTVQSAVDDVGANGFVFVPPGTWNEAVTMPDDNVTLWGAGYSSFINGGVIGHAVDVTGNYCVVRDLRIATTAGGGNAYRGITGTGTDLTVMRIYVSASDEIGIIPGGTRSAVIGCHVEACDNEGIGVFGSKMRVVGNYVDDVVKVFATGDDSIITGNYITDACTIDINGENCVWDSNRNPGGLTDNSGTSTVGDNDET